MSTLKRKLASQANGRKSLGPVTASGKQTSARNSIRHGMLANTFIVRGEIQARFLELVENFTAEYQPATETELALVETLAVARWRQWRLWGLETAALNAGVRKVEHAALPGDPPMDLPTKMEIAFRSLADDSNSLQLLQRYQSFSFRVIFRVMMKSISALTELRNARLSQPEPVEEAPATNEPATELPPAPPAAPQPPPEPENTPCQTNLDIDFPEPNLELTPPEIDPTGHPHSNLRRVK